MPAPLSIIIPAYNAEDVLPLCLTSLMPGLETSLIREVILVDGGSEDQTRSRHHRIPWEALEAANQNQKLRNEVTQTRHAQ